MSKSYYMNLIIDYYDSIANEIDIYAEKLLETIDLKGLANETRIGQLIIKTEEENYKSDFEQYLAPQNEPKYTPGVTRTADYKNSARQEMVDRVHRCQQATLDFYHEKNKHIEVDPKQIDTDKENELKSRLFSKSFCFLLNIGKVGSYFAFDSNECPFKLYLVVLDRYVEQDEIDYDGYSQFVTICEVLIVLRAYHF